MLFIKYHITLVYQFQICKDVHNNVLFTKSENSHFFLNAFIIELTVW